MTLNVLGDNSCIATNSGLPSTATYSLDFAGAFVGITGIQLDVLTGPTLGNGTGPGMAINGNFVLTEITLDASGALPAVPVPTAPPLLLGAMAGLGIMARRRRV